MKRNAYFIIIISALGYFVDIYDLILFNVVKKESLLELMPLATSKEITDTGIFLFNVQMAGMLIGGIIWGIWGDKKGRISVLFGSILLYSLANLVNAFVTSIPAYTVVRFIAGLGLAGELGAGVTLVSETMSKEKRGLGTMVIVTVGALGAVVAGLVGSEGQVIGNWLQSLFNVPFPNWKVAYILGGTMGLALLVLRVGAFESGMFEQIRKVNVSKGNFLMLFNDRERFLKYISCILIGVPIWYAIGLLIANSEEVFANKLGVSGHVVNGTALMFCYFGLSAGDLISGLLSQWMKSRRKVVILYLIAGFVLTLVFLFFSKGITPASFYILSFCIGFSTGYWALFVIIASEQFGTNIRSTVTNTVPNFVRGSVPLVMLFFGFLKPSAGEIYAALLVGVVVYGLSLWSILRISESFSKDLNYLEEG